MRNIEFKGKLKGDIDQISTGTPLPDGSVKFREPEKVEKAFALGAVYTIPFCVLMLVLAVIRFKYAYPRPEGGLTSEHIKSTFPALIISLLALWPFTYIHEVIHALLFPKELKKQIYVHPESYSLFVYCEEMVDKLRFVVICLGPAVILGLLPYIITMAAAPYIPPQVMIGLVFFSVMEVAAALGDVVNAYNCIKQVPGGAKVFNRGYHSYWIK